MFVDFRTLSRELKNLRGSPVCSSFVFRPAPVNLEDNKN